MKCPHCRGPMVRVREPKGKRNRPRARRVLYRCIVCGRDVEFSVKQSAQELRSTLVRAAERR